MTDEQLQEIEARHEAALPGPWYESATGDGRPSVNYSGDGGYHGQTVAVQGMWLNPANMTFIAHARTDVPELVAEVRRLQELVEMYRWQDECMHHSTESSVRESANEVGLQEFYATQMYSVGSIIVLEKRTRNGSHCD